LAVIAKKSTGVRPIGIPGDYEQIEGKLGATLAAGDAVKFDTSTGFFVSASSADVPGTSHVVGILLTGGIAGDYATVLEKGEIEGFDLSALSFGNRVFLSGTAGAIDTATSGTEQVVGRVYPGRAGALGTATFDKILKVGV
jgi:hypothetical protein